MSCPIRVFIQSVHIRSQRLTGIIPPNGDGRMDTVLAASGAVSLVALWATILGSLTADHLTLEDATYALMLALGMMLFTVKFALFRWQRRRLCDILAIVFRLEKGTTQLEQDEVMLHRVWWMKAMVYGTYYGCLGMTVTLIGLMVQTGRSRQFFPARLPAFVDWQHNDAVHLACLIWQICTFFHTAVLCGTVDYLGPSMYLSLDGLMVILGGRIERLVHEENGNKTLLFQQKLMEYAKYHQELLRFAKMLNRMFEVQYFIQFGVNTIIICALAIVVVPVVSNDKGMAFVLFYCGTILAAQIFLPCYCAVLIEHRSLVLLRSLYASGWLDVLGRDPAKRKNCILLFGMQLLRPIVFRTWFGFFDISLETFQWVLKTAYSLFSCVSQMN